jgi:hypothetical protein
MANLVQKQVILNIVVGTKYSEPAIGEEFLPKANQNEGEQEFKDSRTRNPTDPYEHHMISKFQQ